MKNKTRIQNFLVELQKKEMKNQKRLLKFHQKRKVQKRNKYPKLFLDLLLEPLIPLNICFEQAKNIYENQFDLEIKEISFVYTSSTLQHLHIIKSFVKKNTRFHEREIHIERDVYFGLNEIFLIFPRKKIGGCRVENHL